ncbi:helix-turn-helix transcriptional regulator [Nostoc sp. CMAA1605]|uniref:helix-turn-helix transcriptional regulator n=1 Tax=Nostoc sp. CMAA1605 TaxID=2055159 RepID=UPI001F2A0BCD|nr:helix-turn-helix transcriptional regulator [Nostoc sp. CMAA1605]MCF4970551.1 helix-turn-helix transcriptional regulator [Nostoc sp. CMAA1605]
MANLQSLFQRIIHAKNEQELKSLLFPELSDYFAAKRSGLFFLEELPLLDSRLQRVMQFALSTKRNPVVRYLVERHTPVHEALVISPKAWQLICPRADHWHVLVGPIVNQGQLVGVIAFTRAIGMTAFDTQNLLDVSALCLHLSAWVATVRSLNLNPGKLGYQQSKTHQLTPREMQIAQLVAQGRTNAQIGVELWITENSVKQALKRMFRKLEVSSRAEMVAQLFVGTQR